MFSFYFDRYMYDLMLQSTISLDVAIVMAYKLPHSWQRYSKVSAQLKTIPRIHIHMRMCVSIVYVLLLNCVCWVINCIKQIHLTPLILRRLDLYWKLVTGILSEIVLIPSHFYYVYQFLMPFIPFILLQASCYTLAGISVGSRLTFTLFCCLSLSLDGRYL